MSYVILPEEYRKLMNQIRWHHAVGMQVYLDLRENEKTPVLSIDVDGTSKLHHACLVEQLRDLKAAVSILELLLLDVDALVLKPKSK